MHILLTANAAWNILHFCRPVVEALMADGHRLTVLAPPDSAVPALETIGCRVVPLLMNVKGLSPIQDLKLIRGFRREFVRLQPDIILSYTINNNIFGAIAADQTGIPFIPNISRLGTAFLSGGVLKFITDFLYRLAFRKLQIVFFQNPDDRALFTQRHLIQEHQARSLPGSGIDLMQFSPMPLPADPSGPVFLMIARLLGDKGVFEFVEAARRVRYVIPGARFQLLGGAGTANRSAIDPDVILIWEAVETIEYLGTAEDVRPVIAKADCVVLPSYREVAPRTLIEAAAMGRPLIATDVPGCRTVVEDGTTGYLCTVLLRRPVCAFANLTLTSATRWVVRVARRWNGSSIRKSLLKPIARRWSTSFKISNDSYPIAQD
ncbi:MAG: glycosyltransferase family 4 protein [Chloroflexi bacterium]|nr:glycosyltransferase family 4 protein [Chloroflexota bacterium]